MKWKTQICTFILACGLFAGCGDSNNVARAIINGQEYEMNVQGVDCWSGPPGGGVVPGSSGVADTPLLCQMNFRSGSAISDYLMISVPSVVSIYRDFLGSWIPFVPGVVWAEVSFQGLPETLYSGQIRFDNISNYSGDTVCAEYEIQTGNGMLDGHFCGRVREGYL